MSYWNHKWEEQRVDYVFPLANGIAHIDLPPGPLDAADAERLAAFIAALVVAPGSSGGNTE